MKRYSVGFMFNADYSKVALITKNRPLWQKGKLNGVGGHCEDGETFRQCMVREFLEETGCQTYESDWVLKFELCKTADYSVAFFQAVTPVTFTFLPLGDEPVSWYDRNNLPDHTLYNVKWMLQMLFDPNLNFPVLLYNR